MAKNQRLVSGVVCNHSALGFRGRMWAQLVALLGVGGSTILFSTIRSNVGIIQREFDLICRAGWDFVLLLNSAFHQIPSIETRFRCRRGNPVPRALLYIRASGGGDHLRHGMESTLLVI